MAEIVVTEIMYDPATSQCSDSYCEWIEIYNNGTTAINLGGWVLCEDFLLSGYVNHTDGNTYSSTTMVLSSGSYAVITDGGGGTDVYNNFIVNSSALAFHVNGASMCGDLKNTGDTVNLTNGTYSNIVTYSNSWDADSNGHTLEKIYLNKNDGASNWAESLYIDGTPGSQNSRYINETEEATIDYSVLNINEFLPDPAGDDDAAMPDGEWVEIYNSGSNAIDLEGLFLKDDYGREVFITDTTTTAGTEISASGFLVVYMNGKSGFLNNDGFEKIKLYDKEENLIEEISYADSEEDVSWSKMNSVWQRAIPTPGSANSQEEIEKSNLEIEKIYLGSDEKAKFGDTLRVKVRIYKGNSTKYSVSLWLEDDETDEEISKKTKVNIYDKFTNNTLTLPVQINPNCKKKFKDDYYDLVLSGLDSVDREEIKIEGLTSSLCEEVIVEKSSGDGNFFYEVLELPAEIKVGEEFTTKLEIQNNLSEERFVKVWSYVYKGSTSLSGNREENLQAVRISAEDSKILELKNSVKYAEAGDYKFKIKIERDDRKTLKEITKDIMIINDVESAEFIEERKAQAGIADIINAEKISSAVVYESSDVKASRNALYFFSFILVLLICYFLFGRRV